MKIKPQSPVFSPLSKVRSVCLTLVLEDILGPVEVKTFDACIAA